ncbi:hypothetical protein U9M48_028137 [Paspalum notatum var. saurae]|uniref:Uncharacterized protein n=1 Tax=Paspalum notatum var. saurae TaxID=547442 RepID=A0AAQ3X158_PASNO
MTPETLFLPGSGSGSSIPSGVGAEHHEEFFGEEDNSFLWDFCKVAPPNGLKYLVKLLPHVGVDKKVLVKVFGQGVRLLV